MGWESQMTKVGKGVKEVVSVITRKPVNRVRTSLACANVGPVHTFLGTQIL